MKTELWINGIKLDVNESIPFPISYSQADAKTPESRKRSTSKTIELPGTVVNNTFFASSYDLYITDVYNDMLGFNFDPTLRYPCIVREGDDIFTGSASLLKVVRKRGVNKFCVALYSEIIDIFQSLGDKLVSELDWSAYNQTLSVANIEASWAASTGSGVVFGLVHYGLTNNLLRYKTNQVYPHIYIKEFVEKCFALSGKTVSSAFLSSAQKKKIVWGYGGGEPTLLDAGEVSSRQANYTGDGVVAYVLPHSLYSPFPQQTSWDYTKYIMISDNSVVTMTQVVDTYAQYNEGTGEIVVFNSGSYNLNIQADVTLDWTLTDTGLIGTAYFLSVDIIIYKNFAVISTTHQVIVDGNPGTDTLSFNINQTFDCQAGDVIFALIKVQTNVHCSANGTGEDLELDVDLNNTLVFNFTAINSGLIDGDTVEISRFLPEMKCSDLLKDIMTMFNMYMGDPDPNGLVVFEPIEDYFFETDDTDNWTAKLCRGADDEIEIEPASNIEGKTYRYRWAEDRDYHKQRYFNLYGKDYGDYDYNVPSTFKKGEKLYQLKQAQTCPVQIPGTDIIIPMIVKRNEMTNVDTPHKGKPRMYFFNGEVACATAWELENSDTGALTSYNVYPQFHHLDDLTTADYDLNFGVPIRVFYTATTYTTKNMFLEHHAQPIRELTGRDSKIVNAMFRIKPADLYHNFMRRLCNIDGVVYRKNLVKDYLSGANQPVKCELIKVVAGNSRSTYQVGAPEIFKPPITNTRPTTTTSTAARAEEPYVPADSTSGNVTITLPADPSPGQEFVVKKMVTANFVYIVVDGGVKTIDGATLYRLTAKYASATVVYDGTNYLVTSVKLA